MEDAPLADTFVVLDSAPDATHSGDAQVAVDAPLGDALTDAPPPADGPVPPDGASSDGTVNPLTDASDGSAGDAAACNTAFTSHVTDTASLHSVSPLPALAGGATFEIRSYMTVKQAYDGISVPIYAPTRMKIVGSKHYLLSGAPVGYKPDWSLEFTSTCEPDVQIGFAHVKEVSPAVEAVSDTTLSTSSAIDPVKQQVVFEAGAIVGYYIKGLNSIAWDFVVKDYRVTNAFINQQRFAGSKLLNAICPYEKFIPSLQSQYLALLAGPGLAPSDAGMKCGTVMHDKLGTIAGLWFLDSQADAGAYGGTSLGVYDSPNAAFIGEDKVLYLAGFAKGSFRLDATNPTYVDPETVTTPHCYQLYAVPTSPSGYAYYQVVSNSEMRVSYAATGLCPSTMPSSYQTYYR
jgi:hypothetical protein